MKNGSAASAGSPQGGADEAPTGVGQVAGCIAVALGIGSVGAGICAACIGGIATLGSTEVIAVVTCFGYM